MVILGESEGTWKQGRSKRRRLDDVVEWTALNSSMCNTYGTIKKRSWTKWWKLSSLLYALGGLHDTRGCTDGDVPKELQKFFV